MKAVLKQKDTVSLAEIDSPALKQGEVLIKIELSGLCRTDVYVAENKIKTNGSLVLGHEFSGTVEAVADGVTTLDIGTRVAVMPLFPRSVTDKLPNGMTSYADSTMMGIHHNGAFAEYAAVPAFAVYPLPDNVSFKQGAYIEPVAASLAVLNAPITPTQKGLIYGDNRIAKLTQRIMQAKGFNNVDICEKSSDIGENQYDYIIETLATTDVMNDIIRAVKPGGQVILKSRQHTPVAFNINTLVMKDISLHAVSYGDFKEAIDLIASGTLKVDDLFGKVYRLEDFREAFASENNGETKKIFLTAKNDY